MSYFLKFSSSLKKSRISGGPRGVGYLRHRVGLGGSKSAVFYEVFGRLISTQINANRAARFVNKVCMYVLLYVQICKIFQVSTNRAARFVNKVCMYVLLYVQICTIFQVSILIRT